MKEITCYECGCIIKEGDLIIHDSEDYCYDCFNETFVECDNCGEIVYRDETHSTIFNVYCNECFEDIFRTCCNCGDTERVENIFSYEGDDYCHDCYCRLSNQNINSWDYKPRVKFFGTNNKRQGYGLEIEIDDGNDKLQASDDILNSGGEHIYLKEDGSLSNDGFEIVTHPATLKYHMEKFPWQGISQSVLENGYSSHYTDTCGLHIHASWTMFGDNMDEQDLTVAKIMLLIDKWYYKELVNFARRDIRRMEHWAKKPDADIRESDDTEIAISKSRKYHNDRYTAVNITNDNTVEFRFFRGTLNVNTILASIQFVDVLINYCKKTLLKDLFHTTFAEVFKGKHLELDKYLQERGL